MVDAAGQTGIGSASENWVMDTTGPTIASLQAVTQSPRSIVVPTLDVTLSKPIDPTSFTWQNITFSKDGGANLIVPAITITQLSSTEFEISNFENLVYPIDGTYTFTVNGSGVRDLAGNNGSGSASDTWVLDTTAPAAPSQLAISPDTGVSNTDGLTDTGNITLTGTVGATGLAVEVYDGLNQKLADAVVNGTTFTAQLSLSNGSHDLRVYAVDQASNVSSDTYYPVFVDTTPATIATLQDVSGQHTSPVGTIDVTFAKAIDPSTLTDSDLSLTENGALACQPPGCLLRLSLVTPIRSADWTFRPRRLRVTSLS